MKPSAPSTMVQKGIAALRREELVAAAARAPPPASLYRRFASLHILITHGGLTHGGTHNITEHNACAIYSQSVYDEDHCDTIIAAQFGGGPSEGD